MTLLLASFMLLCHLKLAAFSDAGCIIELGCMECVPDHMPLVTSHRAVDGVITVAERGAVSLSCGAGNLLALPLQASVTAECRAGRYRLPHEARDRHLLELGCQESIFEDIEHNVEECPPPLQGRAYVTRAGGTLRHVALACYDADRALAVRARVVRAEPAPHAHRSAPLSLLGNFNHMFDARTRSEAAALYADDARLTRRLTELLRHDAFTFAGESLTSARLLAPQYFAEQDARVAELASNRVPAWRSVAAGNLRHAQLDVAALAGRRPRLQLAAGAAGELRLRAGPGGSTPAQLKPGRFPVPRYVWTAVVEPGAGRGLALVLLNDPFVAVSEVRDAVFCESACGAADWLHHLRRNRNYEVPLYGLVFCCDLHNFADKVPEFPRSFLKNVPIGTAGMLTNTTF